jgi:c-di-AMP phosphodiesterase-like protein
MKTDKWIAYIVLLLLALGVVVTLVATFIENPMYIIIPIILFAIIVYCIKWPPAFLSKGQHKQNSYRTAAKASKAKKERPRSKTAPFKVIEGGRDDNDTPRYH